MSHLIRSVTLQDMPEWLRLRKLLWPDASPASHQAEMEECLSSDQFQAFVAVEAHERLIGLLETSIRYYAEGCESRNVGYLEGWYVEIDWRKKGIGTALVQAAEDWARSRGCVEMASDCDLDNSNSFMAHLALDYQEVERSIHFAKPL